MPQITKFKFVSLVLELFVLNCLIEEKSINPVINQGSRSDLLCKDLICDFIKLFFLIKEEFTVKYKNYYIMICLPKPAFPATRVHLTIIFYN